jgi:sugar lactone lactonase YvrE
VARFAPDGTLDRQIDVPSKFVTSLCFTGPGRDKLIVVTADNTEDESRGGTIFRVSADQLGAVGLPPPLATI